MKILVVDDDNTSRKLLSHYLSDMDVDFTTAVSASDAIRKFKNTPFNMVISDWVMPGDSGLDLCKAIRGSDNGRYTFFMCLTALNDLDALEKAVNEGIDFYLTKPVDPQSLKRGVALGRRVLQLHDSLTSRPDADALPWEPDEFETILRNSFKVSRKSNSQLSLVASRFPHLLDARMDDETRDILSGILCNYDHTISPGGSNLLVMFCGLNEQELEKKLYALKDRFEQAQSTLCPALCATYALDKDTSALDLVRRILGRIPEVPDIVIT